MFVTAANFLETLWHRGHAAVQRQLTQRFQLRHACRDFRQHAAAVEPQRMQAAELSTRFPADPQTGSTSCTHSTIQRKIAECCLFRENECFFINNNEETFFILLKLTYNMVISFV